MMCKQHNVYIYIYDQTKQQSTHFLQFFFNVQFMSNEGEHMVYRCCALG